MIKITVIVIVGVRDIGRRERVTRKGGRRSQVK
jgi:hypothetical protein